MIQLKGKSQKIIGQNKKTFIFIIIMFLGVGFAVLSSQLSIIGNTSVKGQVWNIYFDNIQVSEGSIDETPPTINENLDTINYSVALELPGDYYEFTVDSVNAGTIDAMVGSVNATQIDSNILEYIDYSITYLDDRVISNQDVLRHHSTNTYKITIKYRDDIEISSLSEVDIDLNLSFSINYVRSNLKPTPFVNLVNNNVLSDSEIDFKNISSDTNGKGLYVMNTTITDSHPIYYYRGEVDNNNIKFAGLCWKVVRTTQTGGTKLIYAGEPNIIYKKYRKMDSSALNITNDATYPFVYNENTQKWTSESSKEGDRTSAEISFSVKEAGDYFLNIGLLSNSRYTMVSLYKDGQRIQSFYDEGEESLDLYDLTPSNVVTIKYERDVYTSMDESDYISFSLEKGISGVMGCANSGERATIGKSAFNTYSNSLTYSGYTYGTVYEYHEAAKDSAHVYGSGFNYSGGTYTLTNQKVGGDETHHYTCLNETGTCSEISYVYYMSWNTIYYITIPGGKEIDTVLNEMYTNTNHSPIKNSIDNWFHNTFETYFTTHNLDYNDYLEDEVWCNDRCMNTIDIYGRWYVSNGWIPNGGAVDDHLYYSAYGRVSTGQASLSCSSKRDSFTVEESTSGNGILDYPVGLLTADEIMLAGGANYPPNSSYYLNTGQSWWSMSPFNTVVSAVGLYAVMDNGQLTRVFADNSLGIRPSIVISSDVQIAPGGDGSATNPYEVIAE